MASPRDRLLSPGDDALRAWGLSHPVVAWLLAVLPPRSPAPGLSLERVVEPRAARSDAALLARVVSVSREGAHVVGQVLARETRGKRGLERALVLLDDAGAELPGADAWWIAVLARHYARGGPVVDLDDAVPCAR